MEKIYLFECWKLEMNGPSVEVVVNNNTKCLVRQRFGNFIDDPLQGCTKYDYCQFLTEEALKRGINKMPETSAN